MIYYDVYFLGYFITSYFGSVNLTDLNVLSALGIDLSLYDLKDFKVMPGCFCH